MTRSEASTAAADRPVTLVVDGERVGLGDAPTRTVGDSFLCASGERWRGEWRGVPVEWLLDRAPEAEAATHLRVHGAGDHVACVSLADAIGGVVALERIDGHLSAPDRPRFVAPDIAAARTVKSVERLEPVTLAPGEDADAYEALATVD